MMLAEIREGDADAATAAIYHDIRQSSVLPQVNLIYRHLATVPGALPAIGLRSAPGPGRQRPTWPLRASWHPYPLPAGPLP